ncbi:MAG TPA: restriction endonuclease subunit S [Ignavibacteria bacterium]|nr:restriction endonuclease subunit S [Ignavibacteria bacterium]
MTPYLIKNDFLVYFLKTKYDSINFANKGSGIPHVKPEMFWNIEVPLPPLNEQKRIVEKLDKLLAKVEAAKERLDKIPGILRKYRQSVLHAAVTGELTKDWRKKNNKDFDWQKRLLKDISDLRLGKMLDKAKNKGTNTKYLRNINVRWFSFNLDDLADIKTTKEEKEKLDIKNGDLLVCEGGEPGRCAVWEGGRNNLTFQKAIHRVRAHKNISPKWIAYNLKNDADNRELEKYFTGTTIKHLTGKSLKLYEIQIPPLEEQKEIVNRVEKFLSKADEIEARYKKAKEHVDKLSQSILAKAFRGELVPQDPNDPPAFELLEKIKYEKLVTKENLIKKRRAGEPAEKLLERIKVEKETVEKKKKRPIKRHK